MTTKTDTSRQLSVKQENAIDLLVLGKTDQEVAEAVGVSRQTVNEWRNHDPVFIAELNFVRQEFWSAEKEHLRSLVRKAVAVLEGDLDGEDPRLRQSAAIHVLRTVGLYGQKMNPFGPTTPEAVLREREEARVWSELFSGTKTSN